MGAVTDSLKTKFNNVMNITLPPMKVKYALLAVGIVLSVALTVASKNKTIVLIGNR